jgi:hypothetical protein
MKGDFTRNTFDPKKHYRDVLLQQGRVLVDADFNEQAELTARRDETTTADIIGDCGGPADNAAFGIVNETTIPLVANPSEQEPIETARAAQPPGGPIILPIQTANFLLSAGRYYVDGIQCENEEEVLYTRQPDRFDVPELQGHRSYLVYLDVWQRHITVLEDGLIREPALGGPDHGTRVKTVWQVYALKLDHGVDPNNPCGSGADQFDKLFDPGTAQLTAGTAAQQAPKDPCLIPASAGYTGLENQLYRVEIHDPGTWKWSRENGSVVTRIEEINGNEITVSSLGPDKNLGFAKDAWVEILDDALELESKPGQLVQIGDVDEASHIITLKSVASNLVPPGFSTSTYPKGIVPERHPKLRRWEGVASVQPGSWLPLESGVQVKFAPNGDYRTGQYWQIPARTATAQAPAGDIEWPVDSAGNRAALPAFGIKHHLCRLGIVTALFHGSVEATDCRCLWPALTAVPRLFYVSGDGQEVMPAPPSMNNLYKLAHPLIVGVANAQCLKQPLLVHFYVSAGGGLVALPGGVPAFSATIPTDAAGLASCDFHLNGAAGHSQQVTAMLLDTDGKPVGMPIIFNANLSIAREVAYDPGEDCAALQNKRTVQDAIAHLASLARLEAVGGDGQDAEPGAELAKPIEVLVTSLCGPVAGATVNFDTGGTQGIATPPSVITGPDGLATCHWTPDPNASLPTQELTATLVLPDNTVLSQPATLRFTANHTRRGTCCTFTVGDGVTSHGRFDSIQAAVEHLPADKGGKICLLPGEYEENVRIVNRHNVTISGCGRRSVIRSAASGKPAISIIGGSNITLDSFAVEADAAGLGILIHGQSNFYNSLTDVVGVVLSELSVAAVQQSAVRARFVRDLVVRSCTLTNRDQTRYRPQTLVVLGDDVLIERNLIEGTTSLDAKLAQPPPGFAPGTAAGGIQIEGLSDRVSIINNLIRGGSRNGITLGSTGPEGGIVAGPADDPEDKTLPQIDSGDPSQPLNFIPPPANGSGGRIVDTGPLSEIRIERNRIYDMGACGIGVERFSDWRGEDAFIRVDQLTILGNHIRRCLLRPIAEPATEVAPFVGYGGISLADVHQLVIYDNLIEGCGFSLNDPVCGIFVLQAEGCDLSRNRIFENGIGQAAAATTALKRGYRGGIVIAFALAPMGRSLNMANDPVGFQLPPAPTGEPAAKIHGNIVTVPRGRALHLNALGPVSVEDNHFTSRGIVEGPSILGIPLAATVWILNLGFSNEFYLGQLFFGITSNTAPLRGLDQFAPGRSLATGQVLFNDNQVSFDAFDPGASTAFSSVLIITADDLGFQDNHCQSNLLAGDFIATQSLLLGFSTRTNSNRFTEGIWNALFSAVTVGWIANTTTCNQATHCILSRCISMVPGSLRYALNFETVGRNPLFPETSSCATMQESFGGIGRSIDNTNQL